MSTTSRLISGSIAQWAQIGITLISQIAFVPLYLTYWNASTYGVWLAIQSLISIITTLDFGFHEFLAYEFLRCGRENKAELSKYLWSGIGISIIINIFQIIIIILITRFGLVSIMLDKASSFNAELVSNAGIVLLFQGITWLINNSVSGLIFRALTPFGYYPRMTWWNFFYYIFTTLTPVVAVIYGADLLLAGFVATGASFIFSVPLYFDLYRLLRKEKIIYCNPIWKFGYKNFVQSLAISGKSLLENSRQQGARLVIAPLVGSTGLTAFSTMRTGSNVALQGLNTIVYPLMPELMRFLHQRDQVRSEISFGTVWFILIAFMAPAMVILQAFVAPLYQIWTHGKVAFNPFLFATLSLTVLIFALAQPAIAIVKGNNLLKPQLVLSALAAVVGVGGICVLVPLMGILGAGIALVIAEIVATYGYKFVASNWLHENGLLWPKTSFNIATTSIWIAAVGLFGMILFPTAMVIILLSSMLFLLVNAWKYWNSLPTLATNNIKKIITELHILNKLFGTTV